jgi:hypothetical protein
MTAGRQTPDIATLRRVKTWMVRFKAETVLSSTTEAG